MNDANGAKQQIVEQIKQANNVLVTVSQSPSVDELSAALGLTLLLNKMNKHATAVVSGDIPPAITFLDPQKTFENTVDSLRDFIIALDKEKADHLRYKVDGDVVKIFITPYRTTITDHDLAFSQGDYNVELVLALNVAQKEDLDQALTSHGRILHDATVATIGCGDNSSNVGSIDWTDEKASSLSEMLVSITESLKSNETVVDEQIATAFLTGIVAATDRFSNNRTSSRVMTMAAQLMAAGANQQLIAAKLEEAHEIGEDKKDPDQNVDNSDGTTDLSEGESKKLGKNASKKKGKANKKAESAPKNDGSLAISHEKSGDIDAVASQTAVEEGDAAAERAESELAERLNDVAPQAAAPQNLKNELEFEELPAKDPAPKAESDNPSLGGTLNATTEQAQKDKTAEENSERNKTILSHNTGYVGDTQPTFQAPFSATSDGPKDEPEPVDIFATDKQTQTKSPIVTPPASQSAPSNQTLADIDKTNRSDDHEDAQAAVAAALQEAPFTPDNQPTASLNAQPLGDNVPHSAEPAAGPAMPAPLPPLPPMPQPQAQPAQAAAQPVDFTTLPPPPPAPSFAAPAEQSAQPSGAVPPDQLGQIFGSPEPTAQPAAVTNDPNQFRLPGQQ